MHGVGADDQEICPASFHSRLPRSCPGGLLPAAFPWSTSISAKSTEKHQTFGRMQIGPAFLDRLVDDPVILERRFPAHAPIMPMVFIKPPILSARIVSDDGSLCPAASSVSAIAGAFSLSTKGDHIAPTPSTGGFAPSALAYGLLLLRDPIPCRRHSFLATAHDWHPSTHPSAVVIPRARSPGAHPDDFPHLVEDFFPSGWDLPRAALAPPPRDSLVGGGDAGVADLPV